MASLSNIYKRMTKKKEQDRTVPILTGPRKRPTANVMIITTASRKKEWQV
jgi:hypothetical protein